MRKMAIVVILVSLIFVIGCSTVSSNKGPKKIISLQEKMQMDVKKNGKKHQAIICGYAELVRCDTLHLLDWTTTKSGLLDTTFYHELFISIWIIIDGERLVRCRSNTSMDLDAGIEAVPNLLDLQLGYYYKRLSDELFFALELARNRRIKIYLQGRWQTDGTFKYSRIEVLGNVYESDGPDF